MTGRGKSTDARPGAPRPGEPVVWVVGVGPGERALVHEAARRRIAAADVVSGFETVLAVIDPWVRGHRVGLSYRDQDRKLAALGAGVREGRYGAPVVVAWGDPSVSGRQLVARVERAFGGFAVRILPGISSLQLALARTGLAMEEITFVTLHRRASSEEPGDGGLAEVAEVLRRGRRCAVVFPRPYDRMPAAIAVELLRRGADGATPAVVLERLGLPDERVWRGDLDALAACGRAFSDLSIVVLGRRLNEPGDGPEVRWATRPGE